jgi:hypothetical protein
MAISVRSGSPVPSIIAAPEYITVLSLDGSCGDGEGVAGKEFAIIDSGTAKNADEKTSSCVTKNETRVM